MAQTAAARTPRVAPHTPRAPAGGGRGGHVGVSPRAARPLSARAAPGSPVQPARPLSARAGAAAEPLLSARFAGGPLSARSARSVSERLQVRRPAFL
jgi:hypothetical protein